MTDQDLDQLVQIIRKSPKYRNISPELVRTIARQALGVTRKPKVTVKAIKNRLHQVAGAFFAGKTRYTQWQAQLAEAAQTGDDEILRQACLAVMGYHASTQERLSILADFYATIFAALPPIQTILDVGCGLNPLAVPWMPFASAAEYVACDVYEDLIVFLNNVFPLLVIKGRAYLCDVITETPTDAVDLALLLKVLPPLAHLDPSVGLKLLREINARYILVSFPVQSLGGHSKGMVANYEAQFHTLVQGESWEIKRFVFDTELAFLIFKE